MMITAAISTTPYLTDEGKHTALYETDKYVDIKLEKVIYKHNIVFLAPHTLTRARKHAHTR